MPQNMTLKPNMRDTHHLVNELWPLWNRRVNSKFENSNFRHVFILKFQNNFILTMSIFRPRPQNPNFIGCWYMKTSTSQLLNLLKCRIL